MKTNECELKRLGADAELHEQVKIQIDRGFDLAESTQFSDAAITLTRDLLAELVRIRERHGVPSDGRCSNCAGDKCSSL